MCSRATATSRPGSGHTRSRPRAIRAAPCRPDSPSGPLSSPLLSADGDVAFTPVPAQASRRRRERVRRRRRLPGVRPREPDHALARDRWRWRRLAEPRQRRQRQRRELRLPAQRAAAEQQQGPRLARHASHAGRGHLGPGRLRGEGRLDPAHRRRPGRALGRALVRARPEPLQRDHVPGCGAQAGRHRVGRHPLRLQRRDLADRQRPGRGDPLQPRQRVAAPTDPCPLACGRHAGGCDRGRHPDRIERRRGAGLQLQPGAVPVGRLRRSDARPDPRRHRVGVEPAARLPEWQQPEMDHPQLRDPGLQRVRPAGGRHAAPGLAGTRLRRVLGVQPHSRTAARLQLLCAAAADLDAAHGRHPRCERSGGAVAWRGCDSRSCRAILLRRPTRRMSTPS